VQIEQSFQWRKNFENQLRSDKVTAVSWWSGFPDTISLSKQYTSIPLCHF